MKKDITGEARQDRRAKAVRREIEKLAKEQKLTIGIDMGDRTSRYCVMDAAGGIVEESKLDTTKTGLNALFKLLPRVRVAMETGTHSTWISRQLSAQGHEVFVANTRKVRVICESKRKNDR